MNDIIQTGIAEFERAESKKDYVLRYIGKFDVEQKLVEESITRIINIDRFNTDLQSVFTKVALLNSLYGTFLLVNDLSEEMKERWQDKKRPVTIGEVSRHIVSIAKTEELDDLIIQGAPEAVDMICKYCGDSERSIYSFATKYCSWHNQEAYPIADKYSKGVLYQFIIPLDGELDNSTSIKERMLCYRDFCNIVENFKHKYGLTDFSAKDMDKFLWMYGKEYRMNYE